MCFVFLVFQKGETEGQYTLRQCVSLVSHSCHMSHLCIVSMFEALRQTYMIVNRDVMTSNVPKFTDRVCIMV